MALSCYSCLLFIFMLSYNHDLVTGQGQSCVNRFMELQVVKYKAVNTDGFSSRLSGEVRVLNHRINCSSTNITSVLFGADLRQRTLYPSFQLWRFNATSNLSVVVDERVIYFSTANVSTNGVFEYQFDPPIPAVNGDLVAISQPSSSNSILRVHLVNGINFTSYQLPLGATADSLEGPPITNQLVLAYPITDGNCVNSVTNESDISQHSLAIDGSDRFTSGFNYIYPDVKFFCNGTLTKWIYGGMIGSGSKFPTMQIWRQLDNGNYTIVGSTLVNITTPIDTNVYEFTPEVPLEFQEGDIFGVYVTLTTESMFVLYEQLQSGPLNLRVGATDPLSIINAADLANAGNDFPLVTAIIRSSTTTTTAVIPTTTVVISTTDIIPSVVSTSTTTTTASPVVGTCLSETDSVWNILWPDALPDTLEIQSCPGGSNSIGTATRYCSRVEGDWLSVNISQCKTLSFVDVQLMSEQLFNVSIGELNETELVNLAVQATKLIDQLSVLTNMSVANNAPLFPFDLSVTNDVLSNTINLLNASLFASNSFTAAVIQTTIIDVISNVLDSVNIPGWLELQVINPSQGSELLLRNTESYGFYLAQVTTEPNGNVLSRKNIVMKAQRVPIDINDYVTFPSNADLINFTFTEAPAIITIPNTLILERADTANNNGVPIVNILFNNLQALLQGRNINGTIQTGTLVLSSQVGLPGSSSGMASPALLMSPVNITFTVLTKDFSSPSCVFWDFSNMIGQGSWSAANIETDNSSSPVITCLSTHLTSFAVLVDVAGSTTTIHPVEARVLSALTYIGLSISIICLVATIIFFILLPIYQKKFLVHNFVHLNLSICLLMAYIVFIAGIETAVGDKVGCTIVAAILHYLFLSVFFWMLSEGVMLYLMLMVVFSTLAKKWWFFFLLGWVPAIFPVAITVGITHDHYVNETLFCWLSSSSHVIWSFVIPMILVVIVNAVFLVLVIIKIVKNTKDRNLDVKNQVKQFDLVKAAVKGSVILLPLLGITWVIGLLAINQGTSIFAWLFVIFNTLQGAGIFFFHVIRNEVVWTSITKIIKKYCFQRNYMNAKMSATNEIYSKDNTKSTAVNLTTFDTVDNDYIELAPVAIAEGKESSDENDEITTQNVIVFEEDDDTWEEDNSKIHASETINEVTMNRKRLMSVMESEHDLSVEDIKNLNAIIPDDEISVKSLNLKFTADDDY